MEYLSQYYDIEVVSCGTEENLKLKEEFAKHEFPFVSFVGLDQTNKTFDKSQHYINCVCIDDRLDCLLSSKQSLNILFRYNDNKYEWQEGYKELLQQGKINYVANSWNEELRDILMSWYHYNNR